MWTMAELVAERSGENWKLVGACAAEDLELFNDYLGYLGDRRYSPASVRSYAFDLLHFARWLDGAGLGLSAVGTETLLKYLADCRAARLPGQHDNVVLLQSGRATGSPLPPSTGASLPYRACSTSCASATRPLATLYPGAPQPGAQPKGNARGCWATLPGQAQGLPCG